jgi:TonB family protein
MRAVSYLTRAQRLCRAVLLFAALACPAAPAQSPEIAAAAQRAGSVLSTAQPHIKKVVVFDFVPETGAGDADGAALAANFRETLKNSTQDFRVLDDAERTKLQAAEQMGARDVASPSATALVLKKAKIDAWVTGEIVKRGSDSVVEISVYRTKSREKIGKFTAYVPTSAEVSAQPSPATAAAANSATSIATSGTKGLSYPRCTYCPQPKYADSAVKLKIQGTVTLEVVVNTEGAAENIRVIRGLPEGLTQKAIEAVRSWKFSPATDRDGNPAPVMQPIECEFKLY